MYPIEDHIANCFWLHWSACYHKAVWHESTDTDQLADSYIAYKDAQHFLDEALNRMIELDTYHQENDMKDNIKTPLAGSLGDKYEDELRVNYDNSVVSDGDSNVFFATPTVPDGATGCDCKGNGTPADPNGPCTNACSNRSTGAKDRTED